MRELQIAHSMVANWRVEDPATGGHLLSQIQLTDAMEECAAVDCFQKKSKICTYVKSFYIWTTPKITLMHSGPNQRYQGRYLENI